MEKYIRFFLAIFCLLYCTAVSAQSCQQTPPKNIYTSDITSCAITMHWSPGVPGQTYKVAYKLGSAAAWSLQTYTGTDTFYTFSGLKAGSIYNFVVIGICPAGGFSKRIRITATTASCELPSWTLSVLNTHSVQITATTSCPYDSMKVRYWTDGTSYRTFSFPYSTSYLIDNLDYLSTYYFQVSTCINTWSATDTVRLPAPPNVILLLVDDSRYDYYSCNGAPSFFHTPNIDRIANEGVNFKKSFVVTSLCAPSRASIATGLFTLKTGVTLNLIPLDTNLTTIPKVLKAHGYYTALLGKNQEIFEQGAVSEFNYSKYIDPTKTTKLTDSAIALIHRINQPLFMWYACIDPHLDPDPLPQFVGRYDGYQIPWGPDTAKYTINYPSFIYSNNLNSPDYLHGIKLDTTYRHVLEVVAGLDSCIGKIIEALENTNKLDNTLLIFMSDNGQMLGSHWLKGKTEPYEPSVRIPIFMRYPKWFTPGSVVTNNFAMNLDIAPTIYQAAEVNYTGPLDGFSLKDMYDGLASRNQFYYLMIHDPTAKSPTKRSIRDENYKYTYYVCNHNDVEEFFDMKNDSMELYNLINSSSYQSIIQAYRQKLDSMRIVWNDTAIGPVKNCFLDNPTNELKEMLEDENIVPTQPVIYPSLTSGDIQIFNPWNAISIRLYDRLGKVIEEWNINEEYNRVSLPLLPDGIYFMNISSNGKSITQKLVLQR